ncbi:MAG: ParB/RepB/Spo0J family partition protein [Mixta calida]|uniref:ParB/RepB/Spo0J family partition protein n=1 Tax=Mixta calida TaxID=665913 RepID=UPI002903410E|nr:ParB/RepB/Spo0J family partition protein [Mixta calida]
MARKPFKSRLQEQQSERPLPASVRGIGQVIENKQPATEKRDPTSHQIMTGIARPELEAAGQIIRVPIDDVYAEEQVRPEEDFDENVIRGMEETFDSVGILTPPRCFPRDKRGYRLWLGETRWRTAKKRGDQYIDIYVGIPPESDKKRIIGQLIENLQQSGLKPLATAAQFLKLKNEHGMTGEEIAKTVGKPTAFVSKHLRLVDAPAGVTALLRDKITADVDLAYTLTQLHETSPEDAERLVKAARQTGITRKQVKEALERAKGHNKISHAKSEPPASPPMQKSGQTKTVKDWLVAVEFDGQAGFILTERAPDAEGYVWIKLDNGEASVEAARLTVTGLRPAK